jgi:sensor c-di-GMP phosphodiesterase-like protein
VALGLKSITTQGCDKTSLDSYRQIKLNNLYFGDIGFIEKGKIICTAFWGKLATPVPLPAELHKTPRGFLLAQFSRKDFFTGNAAIYNNIIIFTSRYAYDKFTPVTASYSLSATTKTLADLFSAAPDLKRGAGCIHVVYPDHYTVQRLLGFVRHCKTSRCGLASLPPFILTLLAIILYFIWVAITLFIFRIHEDRFSLERTLIKAVITNTFSVNYQPIIRIRDQKIVGVEVLSRWRDQKHGDVSPELFIPLIKKIGLYKKYYSNIIEKSFPKLPLWRLNIS